MSETESKDEQLSEFHNHFNFLFPSSKYLTLISAETETRVSKEKEIKLIKMACYLPFNNRNLDISFFVFKPTVIMVEELVEALQHISICTQTLGCLQTSIFRSIHGNMIIWYGAWTKRSSENKEILTSTILSMLTNLSTMAILIEHNFFDAYAGDSREGSSTAKFCIGDIIYMNIASPGAGDINDLSYANLALFRDRFLKMEGAISGVCLKCQTVPRVSSLVVWKSLQYCYSWVLNSDYRKTVLPYLDRFNLQIKYDIFRVVHASSEYGCYVPTSIHIMPNPIPNPNPNPEEDQIYSSNEHSQVLQ